LPFFRNHLATAPLWPFQGHSTLNRIRLNQPKEGECSVSQTYLSCMWRYGEHILELPCFQNEEGRKPSCHLSHSPGLAYRDLSETFGPLISCVRKSWVKIGVGELLGLPGPNLSQLGLLSEPQDTENYEYLFSHFP
jgi:hypothetical protein